MALFYDWLFYDGERDNIMNIEPAILVMYHSMRPHPAITATLLDFLCRIIPNFYPPMALTVSSLLIQEYTPRKWRPLHWLSWLVTCLGVVFVMVAHGHYTLNVLIAYYVTTRIFWMYHTMACNTILKQNGPSNYFSRLWWYCIFSYFERNVGGVVPRRYEWPLPWPRHFLSKYPDRNC